MQQNENASFTERLWCAIRKQGGGEGVGGVEEHRKHTSRIAASGFYEVIHLDLTVLSGRYTRPTPELGTIVNTL